MTLNALPQYFVADMAPSAKVVTAVTGDSVPPGI
jgi:hypothetical protein